MRARLFGGLGLIVLIAIIVVAAFSFFVVDPTKHALVLRFGQTIRAISQPGLYLKVPLIDNVVYIEKRLLDLDSPPLEVNAGPDTPEDVAQQRAAVQEALPPEAQQAPLPADVPPPPGDDDTSRKRLVVDAFGRYKVVDPLLFYQALGTEVRANQQLADILSSAVRRVVGDASFTDLVKNRRAELMERITQQVDQAARSFGIEVVDVKIRRADLPVANSQAVYQRMQTERQQVATAIRAAGEQASRSIRADADRDSTVIVANARQRSEEIRGDGDAQRNRIFADAFGRDPAFFNFYRSMQAYREGLQGRNTRLLISPNSDFFRFFNDVSGAAAAPSPEAGAQAILPLPLVMPQSPQSQSEPAAEPESPMPEDLPPKPDLPSPPESASPAAPQ